jgi:NADPH-dependent curcumin reductase CurA
MMHPWRRWSALKGKTMAKRDVGFALLILALTLLGGTCVAAALAPGLIAAGLVAKGSLALIAGACGGVGVALALVSVALI